MPLIHTYRSRAAAVVRRPAVVMGLGMGILLTAYVVWAGLFIRGTSVIAIDGRTYPTLLDDAMISMRYGWNLSHGFGLVWNPGERVEGYTNLLMTLVMALATYFLPKTTGVLAVQGIGVLTMVAISLTCGMVARGLVLQSHPEAARAAQVGGMVAGLVYYPMSYWTLFGMETGLTFLLMCLALLCSIQYGNSLDARWLTFAGVLCGLAYLARPDSLVLTAILFAGGGIAWRHDPERRRAVLRSILVFLAFPIGQLAFRYIYYGNLVPNTYALKIQGIPLMVRVRNGWAYSQGFLRETGVVLMIAMGCAILGTSVHSRIMAAWIVASIAYQVWAGGDFSEHWRMTAGALVTALVIVAATAAQVVSRLSPRKAAPDGFVADWFSRWSWVAVALGAGLMVGLAFAADRLGVSDPGFGAEQWALLAGGLLVSASLAAGRRHILAALSAVVLVGVLAVPADRAFAKEIMLVERPDGMRLNHRTVNTAVALAEVTEPEATVGVFAAGVIPYYAGRRAIDFLGKTDAHVARVAPDYGEDGLYLPGHNRYDLKYSIMQLSPTYVPGFVWIRDDLTSYGEEHYRLASFRGVGLLLLRDDENVRWSLLEMNGR